MISLPEASDLNDCLDRYINHCRAFGDSPFTLKDKRRLITQFIHWCNACSIVSIHDINIQVLEEYRLIIAAMGEKDKPLDISTQYNYLSAVTCYLKRMANLIVIDTAYVDRFRMPKIPRRLPKDLPTLSEIKLAMHQSEISQKLGLRDRAIIEVFFATGIRRSELANLSIKDIDFENQLLTVREGKTKNDRNVPIAPSALNGIKRYMQEMRLKHANFSSGDTLFLTLNGTSMAPHKLTDMVTKCFRRAGVDKPVSCHKLRHWTATEMVRNGADIRVVQEMLGHADISSTQIYVHVTVNDLRREYYKTHPAGMEDDKGA